ncbi:hypothetical protein [Allopontixanthobacter sp.]|uniref:hypothetical protein n=1 Tax=Allopontixanthobacter sp. TaxID=2906452 RepID=UPI002ABC5512|nr:hypothetical protein [Allopontixanthobacter sp.]MDZ4306338.1 hypothetical protein [Allopontixanthobacter sp.]
MARKIANKAPTDHTAKKFREAADTVAKSGNTVPGPSTNPNTNLIIHDIALRSVGRIVRLTLEKGLLSRRYDPKQAKAMVENRSVIQTLAAYGVTKLATRSLPGAAFVGGGLLAKTLYDRSKSRRAAQRAGDKALAEQAEE